MAESNFGIMELLEKLLKERGGTVSDKEMGIMSGLKKGATDTGKTGSGYQSWLDKNRFDRPASTQELQHVSQNIDPLANTTPYNNATTGALNTMRGLVPGAMSGREYEFMVDGMSEGYSFDSQPTEQAIANMRTQQGIQPNLGGGMDSGAVSDVDAMFAKTLGQLPPREQAEIISATQGMTTDEQIDNFKRQYLQGRISPYELEMQSNLGF